MAQMVELKAAARSTTGKAAAKVMRKLGNIPAIVYGGTEAPQNVEVECKQITKELHTGHLLSTVYMLNVAGTKIRVIPRDIQLDPVRDIPLHVDFMRVSASSRITVEVPVHFINELASPGLKRGGVLNVVRHEIGLSCPADAIPEAIEVDLSGLEIGDPIHISMVKLPENVEPTIDRDFTIATIAGTAASKSDDEGGAEGSAAS
jgi:large subunit ribosomal protein L25